MSRRRNERKRIVVVGTRGFPHVQGGVEKHCEELYPRLAERGWDVTVFTRTPYIGTPSLREWKGVKFIHQWCPRKKSLEAILHTLVSVLRARLLKPDVLHFHAIGPSLFVPLAKKLGMKVVMTHHGPDYRREKWQKNSLAVDVLRKGEQNGVVHADRVIYIARWLRHHIAREVGEEFLQKAVYIPNGVTVKEPKASGKYLRKYGLSSEGYVFTAARFVPEKNLLSLVRAARYLREGGFPLTVVIAGDADHETEYSRRVKKEASETENVVLTGFVTGEEKEELFSNAGLFVLPSTYEGLPLALLEAISYKRPVLVSKIEAHVEEIPLPKYCYVPIFGGTEIDYDASNIATCIERVWKLKSERPEEVRNDVEKLFQLVKKEYNWDKIAEQTEEVYHDVLSAV